MKRRLNEEKRILNEKKRLNEEKTRIIQEKLKIINEKQKKAKERNPEHYPGNEYFERARINVREGKHTFLNTK
jgi:hypothetical protein